MKKSLNNISIYIALAASLLGTALFSANQASAGGSFFLAGAYYSNTSGDHCLLADDEDNNTLKTSDHYDNPISCTDAKSNEHILYDGATNTLTLNNFSDTSANVYIGWLDDEIQIKLIGDNIIDNLSVTSGGGAKIIGPGTLRAHLISTPNTAGAGKLYIQNSVINAERFEFNNSLTIENSDVNLNTASSNCAIAEYQEAYDFNVINSNVKINASCPISLRYFSGTVGKISLSGSSIQNGLKALTFSSGGEDPVYFITIGDDNTKLEPGEYNFYSKLINLPSEVVILATKIISGADQTLYLNKLSDLVVKIDKDVSTFEKLVIDGKEVPAENYTVTSGSTVITVKADYISKLNAGEHSFAAYFSDDENPVTTKFTVALKAPKTGVKEASTAGAISTPIITLLSLALLSLASGIAIKKHR